MDPGIKVNGLTILVDQPPGQVALQFGNQRYIQNELVPYSILGARSWSASSISSMTAGYFVSVCMTDRFGPIENWPPLARAFVFPTAARTPEPPAYGKSPAPENGNGNAGDR